MRIPAPELRILCSHLGWATMLRLSAKSPEWACAAEGDYSTYVPIWAAWRNFAGREDFPLAKRVSLG